MTRFSLCFDIFQRLLFCCEWLYLDIQYMAHSLQILTYWFSQFMV